MQLLMGNFINKRKDNSDKRYDEKQNCNDYDILVQSLRFEMKAKAMDKYKTQDEIENNKLETSKLAENELIKRMRLQSIESNTYNFIKKELNLVENFYKSPDEIDFFDYADPIETDMNKNKNSNGDGDFYQENYSLKGSEKVCANENLEWLNMLKNETNEINGDENYHDFSHNIEKIILSLNAGLDKTNKDRLYFFAKHLVESFKLCCLKRSINYKVLDHLSGILFGLSTKYFKKEIAELFVGIIRDNENELNSTKQNNRDLPNFDTVRLQ